MIFLISVIKTFLLSHLITKFEPLHWTLDVLWDLKPKNQFLQVLLDTFRLGTSCMKCCSLWLGIFTGGVWVGITTSFISYLYTQLLSPYIEKIRFQ